ncbi:MAG TPA: branched-chain amino acid ABC transporter permease [Burkholderiales bacterium]|nr:branched-chain amino acid ABC transporter permease [Burkholderiales bacterium]
MTYRVERATKASRVGAIAAGIGLLVLISLPGWGESSWMRVIVEFACLLTLAQMWNLLAGYGGVVSIGQQGFFGLGAYALFVLADDLGINPFLCVPLAGAFAALMAVPTAKIVFRLSGGYFAVGTWVVAEVYRLLIANASWLGGGSGKSLAAVREFSKALRESTTYWIALAVAAGSVGLVYLLLRSRHGLALTSIRDSERASESQGIDVAGTKFWVYIASAAGCGLAGALYFLNIVRISPDAAFNVGWTAYIIFIVVIGGIGTIEGPILGTLIFFLLRGALADYGSVYLIVLGVVAVVVMVRFPRGLWGYVQERFDLRFFPVQRRVKFD